MPIKLWTFPLCPTDIRSSLKSIGLVVQFAIAALPQGKLFSLNAIVIYAVHAFFSDSSTSCLCQIG